MTLHLNLPANVQASLLAQAEAYGLTLEDYVSKVLQESSDDSPTKTLHNRRTLLDLFAPLRDLDLDFPRNSSISRPIDL
jgi:hypothetical protein